MVKKTKTSERILFGMIALFMVGSTVAMYVSMVMGVQNQDSQPQYPATPEQQAKREEILGEYMKKYEARSRYLQEIGDKLSAQYYEEFSAYKDANKAYNAESIKELATTDLKDGDGEVVTEKTAYRAYYMGWLADGTMFDSSFDEDKLLPPLEGSENLIEGWKKGILGMKIGGVREIAIPANQAYGDQEQGSIPANSPLKFIIKLIPPMTDEEKANIPEVK